MTPGRYEAGKAYKGTGGDWYAVVFAPEKTGTPHAPRVAEVYGLTREECEANARAVAGLPGVLEALQRAATALTAYGADVDADAAIMAIARVVEG